MGAHIAVVDRAAHLEDGRHDGGAVRIAQALAGHDDHAALFAVQLEHPLQELLLVEGALGQVDHIRAVAVAAAGQGAGGGDPSGIAAHGLDHAHVDGQAAHILAHLAGDGRDVTGGGAEARGVVGDGDVVVDGLGDAHHPHVHALGHAGLIELAAGVHAAVAAVEQHIFDVVLFADAGHVGVILGLQRVPAGADGGGGGLQQQAQLLLGHGAQLAELLPQHTAAAADGTVDLIHLVRVLFGFGHRAVQRGIDHGGGCAAVHDQQISFHGSSPCLMCSCVEGFPICNGRPAAGRQGMLIPPRCWPGGSTGWTPAPARAPDPARSWS